MCSKSVNIQEREDNEQGVWVGGRMRVRTANKSHAVEWKPSLAVCLALRRPCDVCLWPIIPSQLPCLSVGALRLPITAVSVWAWRETPTVNVPGHPWQSAVFLRGLEEIHLQKVRHWVAESAECTPALGNWRLVDCVSVKTQSQYLYECGCDRSCVQTLQISPFPHTLAFAHTHELCGSLTVRYIDVCIRLDAVNDVWSSLESLAAVQSPWNVSLFPRYSWGRRVHASRPGEPADFLP